MKIVALIVLAIGAFIAYGARMLLDRLGREYTDKALVIVKSVGLVLVLAAAICIFVF